MWRGQPTGSAMPLMWAHAEYIKLLRSTSDGRVYEEIPEVAKRYLGKRARRKEFEVWKPNRHVRFMRPGEILRVHGESPFILHWSSNGWKTAQDKASAQTVLQIDYVDLEEVVTTPGTAIHFTFFWTIDQRWEGQNYLVTTC